MTEPEDLARYLTDATGNSWTVRPLPNPIYDQTTAAYANNGDISMYAILADVPVLGKSLHVVADQDGAQRTCTIELRGHGVHAAICRADKMLRIVFEAQQAK